MQIAFARHLCPFQNGPLSKVDLARHDTKIISPLLHARYSIIILHQSNQSFVTHFSNQLTNILFIVRFNCTIASIILNYLSFVYHDKKKELIMSHDRIESSVLRRANDICMQSDSRDACRVNQVT